MRKLVTENIKGCNSYSVVDSHGNVIARSHCVQVKLGRYSILVNEKFAGIRSEAQAVEILTGLVNA